MITPQSLSDGPPAAVARAPDPAAAAAAPTLPTGQAPPGRGRRQRVAAAMRAHMATPVAFSLGGAFNPSPADPSAPAPAPAPALVPAPVPAQAAPPAPGATPAAGRDIKLVAALPDDAQSVTLRPHPGSAILAIAVRDGRGVYPVPLRCASLLSGWWQLRPDRKGRNCWHGGEARLLLPELQGAAFVELTLVATGPL